MKKMQTRLLKILGLAAFLFPLWAGANPAQHLKRADSLFNAKQYTQSFDNYLLVYQSQNYTPAMLLKMAFIQEGLGHVSQAIFYLQQYHKVTHDEQVQEKIMDLATRHKLEGYESGSFSNLVERVSRYQVQIYGAFGGIMILLVSIAFAQKRRGVRPMGSAIALVMVALFFLAQVNLLIPSRYGIVAQSATYLMSGPSAGASVVAIIEEGHQLKISGKEDVWLRVEWLDKVAYIKEDRVLKSRI